MAAKDDSVVKREEFLAALKTLEPVNDQMDDDEADDSVEENDASIIAAIAEGVMSEVETQAHGKPGPRAESGKTATVAKLDPSRGKVREVAPEGAYLDEPTFEDLVREALAAEMSSWLRENLEDITERIVRDEIRIMGRRRG